MGVLKTRRGDKLVAIPLGGSAVTVGSGGACQIIVKDAAPSSCHISKTDQGFLLRDLSGATTVNGKRIKQHVLQEGDVIQVGSEKFTYATSVSTGQTARVPAAAPPPPTTRMPAQPAAARTATGRVAAIAAPPVNGTPTERSPIKSGSTGRVEKQGTGRVERSTGRVTKRIGEGTGATKRITGRTSRRIPTKTSTFSLPTTRKGKMIALCVVLGILGIGGIMYLIISSRDNPEEIKKNLQADIEKLNKMPNENIVAKANFIRQLLVDEKYKKYAGSLLKDVERASGKIFEMEKTQKEADNAVRPFMAEHTRAKEKAETYENEVPTLYDKIKPLVESYGFTNHGAKLKEIRDEYVKILDSKGKDKWTMHIVGIQAEVLKLEAKGDFPGAKKVVDDFGAKYKENDEPQLYKQLKDMRDSWDRKSEALVTSTLRKARTLVGDGKKDEAIRNLEALKEGMKELAGAKKLDQAIREVKEMKPPQ